MKPINICLAIFATSAILILSCSKEDKETQQGTNPITEQPLSIDTVRGVVVHKNVIPAALRPTSGETFFVTEDLTIFEVTDTIYKRLYSHGIITKKYKDTTIVEVQYPFQVSFTGKCGIVYDPGWYYLEVEKSGYKWRLIYPDSLRRTTTNNDIGQIRTLTGYAALEVSPDGTLHGTGVPHFSVSKIE